MIALLLLLSTTAYAGVDDSLSRAMRWDNPSTPDTISDVGLYFSVAGTLATSKSWKEAGIIAGTFATTYLVVHVVKTEVRRQRPSGDNLSMPSGHTAIPASAAAYLCRKEFDWKCWTAIGTTAVVAWGRISAGAHYPTDTLVGTYIGAGNGILIPLVLKEF
jgi:membrane-associated phospholipid phosphatase